MDQTCSFLLDHKNIVLNSFYGFPRKMRATFVLTAENTAVSKYSSFLKWTRLVPSDPWPLAISYIASPLEVTERSPVAPLPSKQVYISTTPKW